MDMSLSKLQELVTDREAWHACSPWGRKELYTMEQLNWQLFSFPGGELYGIVYELFLQKAIQKLKRKKN